jgi:3D-(3,5/4)-trihydroxycyclohexane-1,2-dione acylhydrolase (decyclizing)
MKLRILFSPKVGIKMEKIRLTTAQATIKFLKNQYVERDGVAIPFFAGCFGIFGHGNLAGIGEALQENPDFRYFQSRNEQSMVHTAAAFAKMKNRMQTFICTASIGPGSTNMLTAAAGATINRLPVLLLPGDIFSRRNVAPVLQQLESELGPDQSVNDCFKPISRFWDRINRPDQILSSLPEAMRVLTDPAETGAVTICMPQDVQAESFEYPIEFFNKRIYKISRNRCDQSDLLEAVALIKKSKKPLIVAGGGVIYSEATSILKDFVDNFKVPVAETHAGKGSLKYDHPLNLGAMGVTGTLAANLVAQEADLVIGIGTRYSDFTTASKTAFKNPLVKFININVKSFDAFKHHALPLVGDAKETLNEIAQNLEGFETDQDFQKKCRELHNEWENEVERIYGRRLNPLPSQGELIGVVNEFGDPNGVMICAAGSLPGDLHKLWRSRHSKQYQMEYGFSCMGHEIAGGLGVKMADPERETYVLVGDGSYLMNSNEIITAIQENQKLTVIIFNNNGYKSIGSLSRSLGSKGFGTRYAFPQDGIIPDDETLNVSPVEVDYALNAKSLGGQVWSCKSFDDFKTAIMESRSSKMTNVIIIENDRFDSVPGYHTWWDVPVAEVSTLESVQKSRKNYEEKLKDERYFFQG